MISPACTQNLCSSAPLNRSHRHTSLCRPILGGTCRFSQVSIYHMNTVPPVHSTTMMRSTKYCCQKLVQPSTTVNKWSDQRLLSGRQLLLSKSGLTIDYCQNVLRPTTTVSKWSNTRYCQKVDRSFIVAKFLDTGLLLYYYILTLQL